MDIRKEWESCLGTPEVQSLFETLRKDEGGFAAFSDLSEWLAQMRQRTPENFALQDACLWALVRRVQQRMDTQAALGLLTYLMAPGLQNILKEATRRPKPLHELWSEVWWSFLQTILKYPLERRRQRVAANLMMDTRNHLRRLWRSDSTREASLDEVDEAELAVQPQFDDQLQAQARALIEGEGADITEEDNSILIGTRVYGEDLRDVARRLGITYEAARKRRQRIEEKLRQKWKNER